MSHDLATCIAAAREAPVSRLFTDIGARPPMIVWDPADSALGSPMLRRFAALVSEWANPDGTLDGSRIDLRDLGELEQWCVRLEPGDAPGEWRYVHYGRGIAAFIRRDLTGQNASSLPAHIQTFFAAVYDASARLRRPVLSVHQPPPDVFVYEWRRLIHPISAVGSTEEDPQPVTGFLAMLYPDIELGPGLEAVPDPILIVDKTMTVRHANKPAREAFDGGAFGPWDRDLFEYSGIELKMERCPRHFVESGTVLKTRARHVVHHLLNHVEVSVSGLLHNGAHYYVIMPRLPG